MQGSELVDHPHELCRVFLIDLTQQDLTLCTLLVTGREQFVHLCLAWSPKCPHVTREPDVTCCIQRGGTQASVHSLC